MKKFTIALLCMIMTFTVTGCGTSALKSSVTDAGSAEADVESTAAGTTVIKYKNNSIWDSVIGDDGRMLVSVKYPSIEIGEYADGQFVRSEEYAGLASAIDKYNKEIKDSTVETADGYADLAKQDMAQNRSASVDSDEYGGYDATYMDDMYYSNEVTASVTRSDSVAFSILNTNYSFAGGAHPYTGYTTYNYDSATGKELNLKDVLNDPESFPKQFITELEKQYSYFKDSYLVDDPEQTISDMLDGKKDSGEIQWTFGSDGITVFVSPYDLAPYAVGPAFVHMTYNDYPDLVKAEYQGYPDNYGIAVTPDEAVTLTWDDGTVKTLTISQMPDQDNTYYNYLSIKLDNSTYQDPEDLYYSYDLYIVKNDGKYYLYADGLSDSDWHILMVYDLNGSKISKDVADDGLYGNAPADPSGFMTMNRTDLLSTYSVMHMCHVGKDGLPESDEDMYWADFSNYTDFRLTALREIKAEVRESGDGDFSEGVIRKGTKLVPYQTDGQDTVILKDDKDKQYKVTVSYDDDGWRQFVDGEYIEDIFDGVMFAG